MSKSVRKFSLHVKKVVAHFLSGTRFLCNPQTIVVVKSVQRAKVLYGSKKSVL